MTDEQTTRHDSGAVLRERLRWQAATRDDVRVAPALQRGEEVDAVHERERGGLAR